MSDTRDTDPTDEAAPGYLREARDLAAQVLNALAAAALSLAARWMRNPVAGGR